MINNKQFKDKDGGFTIVETLVAITVLMIAIAGPLVAANKSLTAALYAKNQMTASFLAQEAMELIKETKNNKFNLPNLYTFEDLFFTLSSGEVIAIFDTCRNTTPCFITYKIIDTPTLTLEDRLEKRMRTVVESCDPSSGPNSSSVDCYLYNKYDFEILKNTGYVNKGSFYNEDVEGPTIFSRYLYITEINGRRDEVQVTVVVTWKDGNIPNEIRLTNIMTDSML
ncbi:MAG: hypothetical protein A2830_00175 [Candidatus Taylorbacteria bacterium RIFCSPHIGHO2_01_FULL_44_110]|uniref:Prepilin-type N-terminal cleavage/methylation domain-containing protein n=1 Tax=Candidatus Taylorbacteria bacterium RIFCSPHIGHO2_12_FULL_45_16 TaxID=1802315 RepID=A0A1G2MY76_9BACT|nr:MAG: hypothetical protein A2830_00175 [Candidatus Taylorbacteria bacterium RIFCSPHIGHO2_01_FULL_44_110]OHA28807.1 MAG: hypothetical protein A3F51_02400 [Candidatus Taylorbacteria bacterium RIFCSPHIGHO2_12_FULL_45_16]OHA32866.1 MAG: hypothetical protein A3A23_03200 [Candidatus Taylorbacteria bacterium RIFCSPLOWO2_01_FULL_45_59]OHA38638.1 MAG: hypothetical protein A3I98_01225 [Candidatus Taylorbacteria bacterium RIFCSPLOWO2_02_FULL_45_10b]